MDANKVEAAVAAADQPAPVTLVRVPVLISSTGRPAIVEVPIDISEAEMLELIGWMCASLMSSLRAQRPPSRLIVPAGILRQ